MLIVALQRNQRLELKSAVCYGFALAQLFLL